LAHRGCFPFLPASSSRKADALSTLCPFDHNSNGAGVGGGLGRVCDGRRHAEPFSAARFPARAGDQPLSGALPQCFPRSICSCIQPLGRVSHIYRLVSPPDLSRTEVCCRPVTYTTGAHARAVNCKLCYTPSPCFDKVHVYQVREEGWLPQHVLVRNEATKQLVGAVPMYLKSHSYGASHAETAIQLCQRLGRKETAGKKDIMGNCQSQSCMRCSNIVYKGEPFDERVTPGSKLSPEKSTDAVRRRVCLRPLVGALLLATDSAEVLPQAPELRPLHSCDGRAAAAGAGAQRGCCATCPGHYAEDHHR
jgi:hypothetical protein